MRILVAGDWHSELHEEVVFQAFTELGHETFCFQWHGYFTQRASVFSRLGNLARRGQNKYLLGPLVRRLNRDFVEAVQRISPDLAFIYRGTHITSRTLQAARNLVPGCIFIGYNNDDPFAPGQRRSLWRHFLAALPEYDLVLAYRPANLDDYRSAGAQRVKLLRSWFVPERNYPMTLDDEESLRFESDVVFVGHYESDQRLEYLEEVMRQGFRLRLFGPGYDWDPMIARSELLASQVPVQLVWGEDYNRALCGAKIALCFFSKLNRDTYTRRCFEIPATRTLLLSEYSDDLAGLLKLGKEADYFRNKEEMIDKIRMYLENPVLRRSVADAGSRRVWSDGHDVVSRMRQVLAWHAEVYEERKSRCASLER